MSNYLKGTREIRTSSFFSYRGPLGVSIANSAPQFYNGPSYRPLVPSWILVKDYRDGKIGKEEYIEVYLKQLQSLNPNKVYEELFKIHGENPVLLCWEPAGEFCHRRIVAKWLEETLGVAVSVG
jgi:uncharacterized protein YeaO (DUF488 family)